MNVLCKPLSRQIASKAALFRLAIYHGAGSSELIAQSQIVDEARDLLIGPAARDLAADHVRKRWRRHEVDPFAHRPAFALRYLGDSVTFFGHVEWLGIMCMDHQPISALDGRDLDLGQLDGAQMNAGPYPALEEYIIDGVGCTHHDVGGADRIFRRTDRLDLYIQSNADVPRNGHAAVSTWGETPNGFDFASGARRHQLRSGLPTRAENADRPCILAREILDAKAVGGADSDALQDAVGKDCQWFAVVGGEQQDQTHISTIRGGGHLNATPIGALFRPGHDVGINANSPYAQFRDNAVH